jgi:hypothetical protein
LRSLGHVLIDLHQGLVYILDRCFVLSDELLKQL